MERLTQWYDDGKIRGVLVKDGYEENALQTIVTKIDECYAAVALLKEYEDTGLTPPEIMDLKERDAAKAPDYEGDGYDNYGNLIYDIWICPNCGKKYEVDYDDYDFCPNCGQRLKWEE